jgi:hypothetical protein
MGAQNQDDLARSKSKWAYRTVGLILAGAAVAILGNTVLRALSTPAAVLDALIFLAAFFCVSMLWVRMVQSWFRPKAVEIVAGPRDSPGSWWQRLSPPAKAAYLGIVAAGAVAAAILRPVSGDSRYALRWGGVALILALLFIVTAFFRRR